VARNKQRDNPDLGTSDYISAAVAELFFGKKERAIHKWLCSNFRNHRYLFVGSGYLCISRTHWLLTGICGVGSSSSISHFILLMVIRLLFRWREC
jgi:hypothetical protein